MFKKQVILVAGFDYELTSKGSEGGADFRKRCLRRMERLIKRFPKDDLKFTLFDVGAGTVETNEIDDKTKRRQWTVTNTTDSAGKSVPFSFKKVTKANYDLILPGREKRFKFSPDGVMSITDIYAFIQQIGAGKDLETLIELSFFSHGWVGGPILVNSHDPDETIAARNSADKDPRTFKDFEPPNMDDTKLGNFSVAFSPNAIIWIWGCAFAGVFRTILRTLFETSKYKSTPLGKLKNSDSFQLNFTEDKTVVGGSEIFDQIRTDILPGGTLKTGKVRSYVVTHPFLELKDLFKNFLKNRTYSSKIATAADVKTFGALLGTYADYELTGDRLMLVPKNIPPDPYKDSFIRVINFYKTYVGVAIDPENRGYGVFLP